MGSRVVGPREARAAVVALRSIDADTRKALSASVRSVVTPLWASTVQANATSAMDRRILAKGVRVSVGVKPSLAAASSSRALSGGLVPAQQWQGWEFGALRNVKHEYQGRSRKGKVYTVKRRTMRQMPNVAPTGRVLYPSVEDIGPRVFALWSQTTIRLVFESFEKGV